MEKHLKEMHSYPDATLIDKLEQLVQWHTQSASQWEDIKKTQEEFHKRQQAQLENFDRRIKAMEAVVRKLLKDTKDDKRTTKSLTKEQKVGVHSASSN